MVNIADDYSDTETYVNSSDEEDIDDVSPTPPPTPIQTSRLICVGCISVINNQSNYLYCSSTQEYICETCFNTQHITPTTADDMVPIWASVEPAEQ